MPAAIDADDLRFGIEAEFGLVSDGDQFFDFAADPAGQRSQRIIDRLPDLSDADLTRGDLAIKLTRWYVEGDERFDAEGTFLRCVPKGVETRTPIGYGIEPTLLALGEQTSALSAAAASEGCRLTALGYNPYQPAYVPEPPYLPWELEMRRTHLEYAAPEVYMLTYGPDVNLSHPGWDPEKSLDVGRKLAYYAPALVSFAANSPFHAGQRWDGLSVRGHLRAGHRPEARVFLATPPAGTRSRLINRARIEAEDGRIEFKAFDAFADLDLFGPLMALLGGLALDTDLPGRAEQADVGALRRAAVHGFGDRQLRAEAELVLDAAARALGGSTQAHYLEPLAIALTKRRVPAHALLTAFEENGRIPLPEPIQPEPVPPPPA